MANGRGFDLAGMSGGGRMRTVMNGADVSSIGFLNGSTRYRRLIEKRGCIIVITSRGKWARLARDNLKLLSVNKKSALSFPDYPDVRYRDQQEIHRQIRSASRAKGRSSSELRRARQLRKLPPRYRYIRTVSKLHRAVSARALVIDLFDLLVSVF